MPWTNQSGGNGSSGNGGGGGGPWGRPPAGRGGGGGSGRGGPPDLEDLLRRLQAQLRALMPHGLGANGLVLIGLGVVVLWLLSGIYSVGADEQGVVLRFGQFVARTGPGINYHLPWPIESVETPKVTRENQINIGYRQLDDGSVEEVPDESLMLTGDENIVDINFTVFWLINDAAAYLFNVQNPPGRPDATIKAVAESAMREVVGQSQLEPILTQDREPIQVAVRQLMQKTLDTYGAGVTITRVQMQKADPPAEVIAAYRDVQAALADQERMRNEGETYANKVIPEARGQAAKIVQGAEAYRQQAIAEASGEAKRFLSVLDAYKTAPEVTRRRIYLETISGILAKSHKVVLGAGATKGVVPYLPLPALNPGKRQDVTVTEGAAANQGTGDQQ
ncbi:MAG: FtsH protease activity modulator HflK [Alphaproteobacteria bacterium]|nr:FtsH protease activity modulator HflK [Alphaproteobacteria bacterium]MDE2012352.1 FtsH protease activity modulator HflK [Alphaproteobacteria bacterium]MDE2074299.1 FtsH protease activity modulator HflK [Alphaproteobacteria bacterium]MDE2353143.1 FtsH protease activity modulator HflK [Alphaproteobacteria bacterium]